MHIVRHSANCHKYGNVEHMRTTVDIPDTLYRQLKSSAALEGRSVKDLILHAVKKELGPERSPKRRLVRLPLVASKRPGSVLLNNARIYEEFIPFP